MKKGFHQFSRYYLSIALIAILASTGCKSSNRTQSVGLEDFSSHTLQKASQHRVAKPTVQSSQSVPYPVQQATYQYPATNPPGQPPRQISVPPNGLQSQFPYSVLPTNQASASSQQVQPYQLRVQPLQTAPTQARPVQFQIPQSQPGFQPPNILPQGTQDFFAGQGTAIPGFSQPGLAQPTLPQIGLPQAATPQIGAAQIGTPQIGTPQIGIGQTGLPQSIPGTFVPGQPGIVPSNGFPPIIQQPEMLDLDVFIPQNPSGRLSAGGTYSSDNSVIGQFILEEHDFDFRAWPRSIREAFGPRAWRGGGQRFRLEVVPGDDLERYLVSWSDPYFRGTDSSLSLSAYYFEREYFDWEENRIGGRIGFGQRLTQQLTFSAGLRLEDVTIDNPRVGSSPQLNANLGSNNLILGDVGFVYDNRVFPFLSGVGTYLGAKFSQAFGDFSYSRGEIDFRNHQTIFSRPDQFGQESGRHIIGFRSKLGFTGGDTPVFENFFAGGISSLRGFDFRGVSPVDGGVRVGGEFQWINSLEYTFPLTNDDMISGALFVDFGTVEEDIELNSENFRVAPGLGLRVHLPYAGLGAPLAFDFAFPVATATGDEEKTFSFFIGLLR